MPFFLPSSTALWAKLLLSTINKMNCFESVWSTMAAVIFGFTAYSGVWRQYLLVKKKVLPSSEILHVKQWFNDCCLNELSPVWQTNAKVQPVSLSSSTLKSFLIMQYVNVSLLRRRAIRRKFFAWLTAPRPSWPPAAVMARSSCGTWFLGVCSVASPALHQISSNTLMVMSPLKVSNRTFACCAISSFTLIISLFIVNEQESTRVSRASYS